MKLFNHTKILTIAILVACLLCIGFAGAASASVSAEFTLTAGTGTESLSATANAAMETGVDYLWECADGTITSPTTKSTKITFTNAGEYNVKLTVTNSTNPADNASKTKKVTVTNPEKEKTDLSFTITGITKPVANQTSVKTAPTVSPNTNITTTSGITWKAGETALSDNAKFGYDTEYTAEFKITIDNSISIGTVELTKPTDAKSISKKISGNVITISVVYSATEKAPTSTTEISVINLTVTAPSKGAEPANAATTTSGVTVKTTKWATSESFPEGTIITKFSADTKYYVKITLENKTNFIFKSPKPTVNVNGKAIAADKVTKSGNTLTVIVTTFDKTAATETNINAVSANVTAPATGNKPTTTATLGATTYEVDSITWYKDGTTTALDASTDTFAADTKYKVTIVLKPKTNYVFNNSIAKANAKINGKEPSDFTRNSDTKVTMSYTFPATTKLAGPSITFTISPEKPKIPSNANTVTVTYKYTITGSPTSATLNFGDGPTIDLGKADASGKIEGTKTHEFSSLGSFTASITAKNFNATSEKKIDFSIGQDVLAAIIEAGPVSGTAPLKVTLNDKSTGTVTTRAWSFGDGSISSGEASTSHTYEKAGTYTITLTVSDGRDTKTTTKTITVTEKKDTSTTDETKKKTNATYEPFITVGGLDIPSPFDIIAEFVRLFQSMFDFDNYHVFGNATDGKK